VGTNIAQTLDVWLRLKWQTGHKGIGQPYGRSSGPISVTRMVLEGVFPPVDVVKGLLALVSPLTTGPWRFFVHLRQAIVYMDLLWDRY
jgi:hypothetical protein